MERVTRKGLTLSQKQEIERMFFGPYDVEWLDERGRIDNSDETISTRTQLPLQFTATFISLIIEERNRTNKPVFLEHDENYPEYVIVTFESELNHEEEKE